VYTSFREPRAALSPRRHPLRSGRGPREFREFATRLRGPPSRESSGFRGVAGGPAIAFAHRRDPRFHHPCREGRRTVVALWHGSEGIRMLRIERSADADGVCFTISGRIEAAHLAELQRLIDEETAARRPLVLDLKDVKLIARDAVTFFGRCEAG